MKIAKVVHVIVDSCRACPYFRKIGIRLAPGCGHNEHHTNPFHVRELPNENEIDPYTNTITAKFTGGIPDWCPLEDAASISSGNGDKKI